MTPKIPKSATAPGGRPSTATSKKATKRYQRPKVAVIGAGCSGLVSLHHLKEQGLNVTCFEQGADIGGLWVLNNSNGRGGAYHSLHINTSKAQSEFSDFPMPSEFGHFPHHSQVARYLSDYARHFELTDHIRFQHRVEHCRPLEDGGYELSLSGKGAPERFDALVVANGHHSSPLFPARSVFERFDGSVLHSYDYRSPSVPIDLTDQRVLVVGMGNSAMDIACELSRSGAAQCVHVSARRGAWIMPKYLRGKPIDGPAFFPHFIPPKLRRRLVTHSFRMLYGKMSDFGLPEPDHLIGEAHPTISTEFPPLVSSGDITMQAGLTYAEGNTAHFSDGSSLDVDAIVFCTGYRVEFPFFSDNHISAQNNRLPLFFRIFHPEHRNVFFIGLLQTIGAVMPVAEAQARAVALHLSGTYNLPERPKMISAIHAHESAMVRRFVPSQRHTMQVVPELYHPALGKELDRGKQRARRGTGIAFTWGRQS